MLGHAVKIEDEFAGYPQTQEGLRALWPPPPPPEGGGERPRGREEPPVVPAAAHLAGHPAALLRGRRPQGGQPGRGEREAQAAARRQVARGTGTQFKSCLNENILDIPILL